VGVGKGVSSYAYQFELRESRRTLLWWCDVLLSRALDEMMRGEELWD
jgi:hypothetical protein